MSDVLDILIVGGGPFGTAVAFRAKELGLNALVIDYDDLMKRIRDYAKDKQILPDYGGGDQMQFPRGGKLVSRLPFGPIDKDDLCEAWKGLYTEFDVPARIGVEFTGLERQEEAWDVVAWDHTERREARFTARHVVLAMGRGVPRQIEVLGDPQGMAFSLKDAAHYVGAPACVIGGGTSAAEAVTAISAAKVAAKDGSAVFWSYRGDKMPKVSRALAEVFFDAFVGNGNIRYLPKSDPVTVTGAGADAMLAIRTSRVQAPDSPTESTQLEFLMRQVIACIGEDIPTALLAKIGTPLVTGGPMNKTRIGVTPLLETQQPNVYLAGDTLSPVYLEVGTIDDPGSYREVRRRGNIKAALRDGVFLAEVIGQKLAGRTEIKVSLEFEPSGPVAVTNQLTPSGAIPAAAGATESTIPMAAAAPPAARRGALVAVLPSGTETHEYAIAAPGTTSIGRHGTDIAFPDDALLSERHATIVADAQGYFVRDDASSRGTYVQLAPGHLCPVPRGTLVKVGNEWLRVGDKSSVSTLTHLGADGSVQGRHELQDGPTIVGRQSPDVSLSTSDQRLSRRHCVFVRKGESVAVRDLDSANGTVIKVGGPLPLADGDLVLIGRQMLRMREEQAAARPRDHVEFDSKSGWSSGAIRAAPSSPASSGRAASVAQTPAAAAAGAGAAAALMITVRGSGTQVPCAAGQTVLEALKAAGVAIEADCKSGSCGVDGIKICEGGGHLSSVTATEADTLDTFGLDPQTYRYACVTRLTGPIVIDIVGDKA